MQCLCCSETLLRHISQNGVYWYCPTCRQTMPILQDESEGISRQSTGQSEGQSKGQDEGHEAIDRPSQSKQYWLYIPLHPEQRKTA